MHINISSLHNAYILRRAHLYTDTLAVLVRLSRASPQLFVSTFRHAGQGLPSPRSHPRPLGLAMSASPFFFSPTPTRCCKLLLRNAWWRCAMPNELLVTSLSLGLVEAFGRTTATSACAMATKRQACVPTHSMRLPPSSLPPVCLLPLLFAPAAIISPITKHG